MSMRLLRRKNWMILTLILLLCLGGCDRGIVVPEQTEPVASGASRTVFAMDTVMELTPKGENGKAACDAAVARIIELEGLLSVTDPESEIYAVNNAQGGAVPLSQDTQTLLRQALEYCAETDGALDISVYPVLRTWGFTTGEYQVPDDASIAALLEHVDYARVELDDDAGTVTLPEGMEIDLGSVAKGYTGDQVMQAFRDAGVTSGMISLGGNVQVLGTKEDGSPWRIAVQDPNGEGYVGVIEVVDQAVITSGGYERYFEQNGEVYWHILDPATGRPAHSGVVSATIVGSSGTMCDALSTALFVMGPERAAEFWQSHEGFDFLLVLEDGSLVISDGLYERFTAAEDYADAAVEVIRK